MFTKQVIIGGCSQYIEWHTALSHKEFEGWLGFTIQFLFWYLHVWTMFMSYRYETPHLEPSVKVKLTWCPAAAITTEWEKLHLFWWHYGSVTIAPEYLWVFLSLSCEKGHLAGTTSFLKVLDRHFPSRFLDYFPRPLLVSETVGCGTRRKTWPITHRTFHCWEWCQRKMSRPDIPEKWVTQLSAAASQVGNAALASTISSCLCLFGVDTEGPSWQLKSWG